jgi:hypothetical protein
VAHPLVTSRNPAAKDVLRDPPFEFHDAFGVNTNQALFGEGTWMASIVGIYAHRLPEAGTLNVLYAGSDTFESDARLGDVVFRNQMLGADYGRRLCDVLSLGGGVSVSRTSLGVDTQIVIPGLPGFSRSETETDSDGLELRGGLFLEFRESWTAGGMASYSWSWNDSGGTVFAPSPPTGPGPIPVQLSSTSHTTNVRAGLGWRPQECFGLYFDTQYLCVDDPWDATVVFRFSGGAEVFLSQTVACRAGSTLDDVGNVNASVNLSYYGVEHLLLEAAYIWNVFPEIEQELGTSHLISLSAILVF